MCSSKLFLFFPPCVLGRYPNAYPEECSGDQKNASGVISHGLRPTHERYDVYCYINQIQGMSIIPNIFTMYTLDIFNIK